MVGEQRTKRYPVRDHVKSNVYLNSIGITTIMETTTKAVFNIISDTVEYSVTPSHIIRP